MHFLYTQQIFLQLLQYNVAEVQLFAGQIVISLMRTA